MSDAAIDRTRTIRWADPLATAARGRDMSGLEFLEAIRSGQVPPAPIGVVHGGLAAALLDTVMGCAVHSKLPRGRAYTTLDVQVRYLRPLTGATGRVLGVGTAVHAGSRTATAEGRIVDEAGKLYATGTASCLLFDPATSPR